VNTAAGRLTDNLRRGHWSALALELLVVVAGILLALLIDGWAQDRRDRASEITYLQFLNRDLQQTIDQLQESRTFEARLLDDGRFVYRSLSGVVAPADRPAVSLALARLGARRTLRLANATYVDLVNTGNLQLIDDRELRDRVVQFYENAERNLAIIDRNNAFFVDEMYFGRVLASGAIIPRPAFDDGGNILASSDSTLRAALSGGYLDEPDPIWRLPLDGPEWRAVRGQVVMRMRISTIVQATADALVEEAAALRAATQAEVARHGH
jgi:hypothetical protein